MNPQRKLTATVLAVGALLAAPVVAGAVHWPQFGGDAGHSGNQPVNAAAMPTSFQYTFNDAGAPKTSVITGSGPDAANSVLAYGEYRAVGGANNDRSDVHIRTLETGAERVPDAQRDVDDGSDDADAFGPGDSGVSFVDTSAGEALGQIFVVHNDTNSAAQNEADCPPDPTDMTASTNDIAIAHYDPSNATTPKKSDVAVGRAEEFEPPEDPLGLCNPGGQVSEGYTVESSPVITPPLDNTGRRILLFIARKDGGGAARLFAVTIQNASSPSAVVQATSPEIRDIADANTKASPSLLYLENPDPFISGGTLYVAVSVNGAGAADVRTFQVGDIDDAGEDGPTASFEGPGVPQTVSVPVTANGRLPGQEGSGAAKAPAIYVAYHDAKAAGPDDDTTTVRKFFQNGESGTMTATGDPEEVAGAPAPALAVTALASGSDEIEGRVVVPTSKNLHILDSETLTPVEQLYDGGETPGATDAFGRTVPLVSGNFIFATNDDGTQGVLNLSNGEPVAASAFTQNETNNGADYAVGQPSLSRGFLQFLTDRGLFVYKTNIVQPPNQPPVARFTITPNPTRPGQTATLDASSSTDADGTIVRYEWDVDNNGQFETDRGGEKTLPVAPTQPGNYPIGLRVTDSAGGTSTVVNTLVVGTNQPPVASFTNSPSFGEVGKPVSFDASGSRDPDGSIAKYQWDLDGNGSFETDTGNNPKASRTYTTAGVINVKLRVTDNDGASSEIVRQLSVTRAERKTPRISVRVTPRRDASLPYRFTTRGRIGLPSGVTRADGCRGRVSVTVKAGRKTISRRTTRVGRDCRYRTRVTFRNRNRIGSRRVLRFIARFQGNTVLRARQAKTVRRRVGRS